MNGPISFPGWKEALAQAGLGPSVHEAFRREILSFLRHCKETRSPATTELARQYLSVREKISRGPAREALRWFFREGARTTRAIGSATGREIGSSRATEHGSRSGSAGASNGVAGRTVAVGSEATPSRSGDERRYRNSGPPPRAADDLGGAPWERDLIRAVRERGFLWRTEQTYREWAVRFVRFIAPRSPYAASGEEVASFLSALAVNGRASPSAQKQAFRVKGFAHAVG